MKFGEITRVTEKIHDGKVARKVIQYEERVRIKDEKDLLAEFLRFRKAVPSRSKVTLRIEETRESKENGAFYVVKCWEE